MASEPEILEIDTLRPEQIIKIPEPEAAKDLIPISYKKEDTRGRLALTFLIGFFVVIVLGMIVAFSDPTNRIDGAKEILLTISGILSGPLGFVIGYYFRSSEEHN